MPIDDRTTNRSYQLPNAGNLLSEDVARLRAALSAIDADVFARYTKTEVDQKLADLINGAPGALNTLQELATAMGNDPNFAATITNALAGKPGFADVWTRTQADARYVQGINQVENVFTGTGSQTTFTLTQAPPSRESILVSVDGVLQPVSAYTLSGTGLILSEAPVSGASIRVLMLGVAGPVQNASTLSFTTSGAGASTRTVENKLRESVSLKDFGAVGDGVADDTAAVQNFFNSFNNGGSGFIPAGTYKITSPLMLVINPAGFDIEGAGANTVVFVATSAFASASPVLTVTTAGTPTGFRLGGFAIQNAGSSAPTGFRLGSESPTATVVVGYQFSSIYDLYCTGFASLYDIVHARQVTFSRIAGWNPSFAGANKCLTIRQNGQFTADLRFEDCQFVTSKNTGNSCLLISSASGPYNPATGAGSCAGIKFRSCDFYGGEKAVSFYAAGSAWITDVWFVDGCQIDQEVVNCVHVESSGPSSLIEDLHFLGMYYNKATSDQVSFVSASLGQIKSVFVDYCTFYQGQSTGVSVNGIACSDFQICHNSFIDQNVPTGSCIKVQDAKSVNASFNRFRKGVNNFVANNLVAFSGAAERFIAIGNDGAAETSGAVVSDLTGDVTKTIENNLGLNPIAEAAVAVGASPFSYKNTSGYTQLLYLNGGSVSLVQVNGFNMYYNATGTVYTLPTGAALTVTYSVAPAMYKRGA